MEADSYSSYLFLFLSAGDANAMIWFSIPVLLLLLACSALISASEVAYFSLTPQDFDVLQQEETPAAKGVLSLISSPRKLLATILISNNFVNIAIVILSEYLLSTILPASFFEGLSRPITGWLGTPVESTAATLQFLLNVVGVTFVLVLFGEVTPKVYANLNGMKLARFMVSPLRFLVFFFSPISQLLVSSTSVVERRLSKRSNKLASKEELDEAIDLTVNQEADTQQEVDLLKSIIKFGEVPVKQIMSARVNIVAAESTISYPDLLAIIRDSGYSRIPIYEDDMDHIVGIVYVKDLISHINEAADFAWQSLIRTNVFYVPEAKKIDDLLKEFQSQRLHMAIVVDEYGGTAGLVSLEDILEEIIGEIKDEFDDDIELDFRRLDDYNYIFEGKTMINDVCRIVGIDTSELDEYRGEADSLAGLLLEKQGFMPVKDSVIEVGVYGFKVLEATNKRIIKVQVILPRNVV